MKKRTRVWLIVGLIIAVLATAMAIGATAGMGAVRRLTIEPVDLSRVADGTYPGAFKAGRFSFSVKVTVKDHRIEAVRSTGRAQAQDAFARKIFERIVAQQSVKVDTVSGASLTTKAVSKAVENALRAAQ